MREGFGRFEPGEVQKGSEADELTSLRTCQLSRNSGIEVLDVLVEVE
jgi:hypothetical protein